MQSSTPAENIPHAGQSQNERAWRVAHLLIDHINDYFTLGRFARTCKAFYDAVRSRPGRRSQLFDQIERTEDDSHSVHDYYKGGDFSYPYSEYTYGWRHSYSMCAKIKEELKHPWYFNLSVYVTGAGRKMRMINEQLASSDLGSWGGFSYREVVEANLLPCYGCKTIKHSYWFFSHHKSDHRVLLGCEHLKRRCADCATCNLSIDEDPETYEMLGNCKKFLVDMPKRFPGFRQCCQHCGRTQWVKQRPKKTREAKQVCEDCFQLGYSAPRIIQADRRRQRVSHDAGAGVTGKETMSGIVRAAD